MATTGPTPNKQPVFSKNAIKYYYSDTTNSVAGGASETFDIETQATVGGISEIIFESSSTDCDIYVSETDSQTATSSDTILYMTGINLGYSPSLERIRYYRNGDASPVKKLYFTIDNKSATATGNWNLNITYEIQKN